MRERLHHGLGWTPTTTGASPPIRPARPAASNSAVGSETSSATARLAAWSGIRAGQHCRGHPPKRADGDMRLDKPPAGGHDGARLVGPRDGRCPCRLERERRGSLLSVPGDPPEALDGVHRDERYRRGGQEPPSGTQLSPGRAQPTTPPLVIASTSRARSTSSSLSRPISSTTLRRSFPPAKAAFTTSPPAHSRCRD